MEQGQIGTRRCLRAAFRTEDRLSHRDILGSLMGMGIVREKVGDILVSPESADLIVLDTVADFLLSSWNSAGRAKLTCAYNLPARYVLHTVGPIVGRWVTWKDRRELAACYRSCLALAAEHDLRSVAFCCISTGEFHFPNQEAAEIAVRTVREFLEQQTTSVERVIFNVFKDLDAAIYRRLLGPD